MLSINNDTGAVTFLNDTLSNVKFSNTAWSPDNKVHTPISISHCSVRFKDESTSTVNCTEQACWEPVTFASCAHQHQGSGWHQGPNAACCGVALPPQGFFYNQYPAPNITGFNALGTNTGENKNQQLWYHVVGTPQDQDIFVLALPDQPLWSLSAGYTLDKK